jgi:hypothetical protein
VTWRLFALVRDLELLPPAKLIMFALTSRADQRDRCWPSVAQICKDTGLKRRAVQIHLGRLVTAGLIVREARAGRVGAFRLRVDEPPTDDSSGAHDPRMSSAVGARQVHPPAHPVRGTRAPGAPEVTNEVSNNLQSRTQPNSDDDDQRMQQPVRPGWWLSERGIIAKGSEVGLPARPGESLTDYKARVFQTIDSRRTSVAK